VTLADRETEARAGRCITARTGAVSHLVAGAGRRGNSIAIMSKGIIKPKSVLSR